jgi:hypothetical protein
MQSPAFGFRPNEPVTYIGTTCPSLTGRRGFVDRIDRKGWVHVTFEGTLGPAKCCEFNLKKGH